MYGFEKVNCPNCDEGFDVRELHKPLRYIERDADEILPRRLVIIGGNKLLHSCTLDGGLEYPVVVYQAQGMVSLQAECSLDRALVLMRNTAEAADVTVEDLAQRVIDRAIRFVPGD